MELKNPEAEQRALKAASMSPCNKRKVGACITDHRGAILSIGYNHNSADNNGCNCEDSNGNTVDTVIHAEVAAILNLKKSDKPGIIYVTHKPCDNCAKAIKDAGIIHTVLVENFLKFDSGKLQYSLIPTSATLALAQVLTYGAKKYKPNNWQQVDDTTRYVDALYRHLEAWRSGELIDSESGLSHLAHAMTNIVFLNHLQGQI